MNAFMSSTTRNKYNLLKKGKQMLYYSGLAEVKRVEKRRIIDLREEVGTKGCTFGKIVKSRIKWAGHMTRMKDEILQKRSETKKQECCKKEEDQS